MKRIILPSLLFGLATAAGCASGGDVPATAAGDEASLTATASGENPRVERRLAHMQQSLELTDEQVALLRPVLENRHTRQEELRQSFHQELEGILTPEQLARLDERRERHGRFGRSGRGGPGGPDGRGGPGRFGHHGPPDPEQMLTRMAEDLDLTDNQVTALRPIFEAAHARHEELQELPREERRDAFRAIREETKAAVDEILTEEQRAKLEERFARRGPRGMHRGMRGRHHFRGDFGGPEGEAPPSPAPDAAE